MRRETLAEVAGEIGLGQHLRLGRSESISGGRKKAAILADAIEAVIAALYLDGGMAAAKAFIAAHWQGRLAELTATPTDAKTRAQEWAQARGLAPPTYSLMAQSGPDHAPVFTVEAGLETGEAATGQAGSKKLAEQEAAAALMERLALSVDGGAGLPGRHRASDEWRPDGERPPKRRGGRQRRAAGEEADG